MQVRFAKAAVDMEVIDMALAKLRVGLPSASLPLSKAKRHLASTLAGRAVAMAQTPGMPRIEAISIKPYGTQQGRILHPPQDLTAAGRDVTELAYTPLQVRSHGTSGCDGKAAVNCARTATTSATTAVTLARTTDTCVRSHAPVDAKRGLQSPLRQLPSPVCWLSVRCSTAAPAAAAPRSLILHFQTSGCASSRGFGVISPHARTLSLLVAVLQPSSSAASNTCDIEPNRTLCPTKHRFPTL